MIRIVRIAAEKKMIRRREISMRVKILLFLRIILNIKKYINQQLTSISEPSTFELEPSFDSV